MRTSVSIVLIVLCGGVTQSSLAQVQQAEFGIPAAATLLVAGTPLPPPLAGVPRSDGISTGESQYDNVMQEFERAGISRPLFEPTQPSTQLYRSLDELTNSRYAESDAPAYIPLPPGQVPQRGGPPLSQLEQLENRAVQAIKAKDYRKAEQHLLEMLQLESNHRGATIALASLYVEQKQVREAALFLGQRLVRFDGDAQVVMLYGKVLLELEEPQRAILAFQHALRMDSELADGHLMLGIAYLRNQQPLAARGVLQNGANSSTEMFWQQRLAYATAWAQLGQLSAADGIFLGVHQSAASDEMRESAWESHRELQQALTDPTRLYGLFKVVQRYDDNTGIVPTTNIIGVSTLNVESFGALETVNVNYDLWRSYQSTVTAGYNGLFTQNYLSLASDFNVSDQSGFLSFRRRSLTPYTHLPCTLAYFVDAGGIFAGGVNFLQRFGSSTSIAVQDSDDTSITGQFRYSRVDFVNQLPGVDGSAVDPDSSSYEASFIRQWSRVDAGQVWQLGYGYNRNVAQGSDFDYRGHRAIVGGSQQFEDESFAFLSLQYNFRNYDNPQTSTGSFRQDRELLVSVSYLRPAFQTEKLYWVAEYAYDLNESDIESSSYDRDIFGLGLQWNFGGLP